MRANVGRAGRRDNRPTAGAPGALPAGSTGVLVTKISPSSPAADSDLRPGDVIQEVNHKPVRNTAEFEQALRNSKTEPLLLVNRQGNTIFIVA